MIDDVNVFQLSKLICLGVKTLPKPRHQFLDILTLLRFEFVIREAQIATVSYTVIMGRILNIITCYIYFPLPSFRQANLLTFGPPYLPFSLHIWQR